MNCDKEKQELINIKRGMGWDGIDECRQAQYWSTSSLLLGQSSPL